MVLYVLPAGSGWGAVWAGEQEPAAAFADVGEAVAWARWEAVRFGAELRILNADGQVESRDYSVHGAAPRAVVRRRSRAS